MALRTTATTENLVVSDNANVSWSREKIMLVTGGIGDGAERLDAWLGKLGIK